MSHRLPMHILLLQGCTILAASLRSWLTSSPLLPYRPYTTNLDGHLLNYFHCAISRAFQTSNSAIKALPISYNIFMYLTVLKIPPIKCWFRLLFFHSDQYSHNGCTVNYRSATNDGHAIISSPYGSIWYLRGCSLGPHGSIKKS